jgi:hypothetical protein
MAREPTRILVPAYDFPGPFDLGETPRDWDVLVDVGKKLRMGGLLVIASPAKGPGWDNGPNPNYEFEIKRLRSICASVVGYITDCYNDTDVDEGPDPACPRRTTREADIERWFGIYNVHGIFIDEVERDEVAHAIQLVQMVRARRNKALIVLNPGNLPSRDFIEGTDPAIVVIRENTFAAYQGWPPQDPEAAWLRDREGAGPGGADWIPAHRLAIIAHTPGNLTGQQAIDRLVNIADRYSIGWIYASHGVGPVYDPLSTYLPDLAERIAARIAFPPRLIRNAVRPIVCGFQQVAARVFTLGR